MMDLKIYEKGHLGYWALIIGAVMLGLGVLALLVSIQTGKGMGAVIAFVAMGIVSIIKGVREAGKPLIVIQANEIEFWHRRKRIAVPLPRIEKVVIADGVCWLKVDGLEESGRISLHKVRPFDRDRLRAALGPLLADPAGEQQGAGDVSGKLT